ncbi:MAG: oligopeptide transporter, OPT family [Candidatus Thermoplasmatota archaeon]|jgi:putative OPT family oligopeptide transporter|nr:oligopeptide transporter, OPT family [Candidatus Thermoplasmatota archaeon]
MKMSKPFVPYIPPESDVPEFTFKAILVGIIITIVMGAANAYLGLFVGMTVSATIPSLVFALVILKAFKGTILEINMSKNIGVAGEALAAGIIFTFPALIVINSITGGSAGWDEMMSMERLLIMVAIALIGGLFGILFTIPLRKVFIQDLDLPYPEGVAAAEVLKVMEKRGRGMNYIIIAAGIGAFMKFAAESGLSLWKERVETVFPRGRIRFFGGVNVSPALLGVGYIIGFKISLIVFAGGILGWVIAIPLVGLIKGWPAGDPIGAIYTIWFDETKWIGIGAVLTGGMFTLWKLRKTLLQSIKQTLSGKKKDESAPAPLRTERDFRVSMVYLVIIGLGVLGLYLYVTGFEPVASPVLTIIMVIATFVFTAVAGYLAGIVGSSNNPISSVTITTLVITALLLMGLDAIGFAHLGISLGMTATILVAAVVCCSAAIAGDSMQELKTAQILGATPIRIQWGRFIGVIVGAVSIPIIVALLAKAYGIGTPSLPSPQAVIMGSTVHAIFNGDFNIIMLAIGVVLAVVLIIMKLPVMAVAIGIYLPFTLTTPIFLGGVIGLLTERFIARKVRLFDTKGLPEKDVEARINSTKEEVYNKGLLFAAGLVAGEAIMGVVVAVIIIVGGPGVFAFFSDPSMIPGLLAFIYLMGLILYLVIRDHLGELSGGQTMAVIKGMFRK